MSLLAATSRRTATTAFRRAGAPTAALAARVPAAAGGMASLGAVRSVSTSNAPAPLKVAYKYIFKSNITYVTYLIVGAVTMELLYGKLGDFIFDTVNKGKLYHQVDWSKFKEEDEEEEVEEEEEEEE